MRQRLREIAGLASRAGIEFLRQQSEIVGHRDDAIEQHLGLGDLACEHIGVGKPQAAGKKRAFDRLLLGRGFARVVPQHKAVSHHIFLDRRDGAANARVRGRKETHRRQQQDAGIEHLRTIGFNESVLPGIKAVFADIATNRIAQSPPAIERCVKSESFGAFDAAVERHPGHDLGRDIALALAAAFPDAVIRLVPYFSQMFDHRAFQCPGFVVKFQLGHAGLVKRIDQFAVDIELQLGVCGIADPNRLRTFVTRQPAGLPFQQARLAHNAVHDLHVRRPTGRGAQQPIVPGGSFLGIAGVHQCQQRKGGVAQPAKTIIPVARAAQLLRQRGRGRCNDAAGRRIGQRLQRDQRSHHQVTTVAFVGAAATPFSPIIFGILQGLRRVDRLRKRQMRRPIGEHKGYRLAFAHLEIGNRGQVLAAGFDRRPQHGHVLPRDRQQCAIFGSPDPGNVDAEIKADHELHVQLHFAQDAPHQPHHVGGLAARGHEIDQCDDAVFGFKPRLQDQRVVPVAAGGAFDLVRGRDQPAAVPVRAQQSRETGIGIKGGPAQPVDRSITADQCRGLAIADQPIVFNSAGHSASAR